MDVRTGCCSAKTGAKCVMWMSIVIYASSSISFIVLLQLLGTDKMDKVLIDWLTSRTSTQMGLYELKWILEIGFIVLLIFSLMSIWMSGVVLGIGIYKERVGFLKTWIVVNEGIFALLIVGSILSLVYLNFIAIASAITPMVFLLIALYVVREFHWEVFQRALETPLLSNEDDSTSSSSSSGNSNNG